ncbi:MAG: endonuclease/exonuclease/phosphatase family protein [Pseudomonadota bacterium]
MRFATYNIEWMNALFDDHNRPMPDEKWSSRYKVTRSEQLGALRVVFEAMDADAVMVIEAPDGSNRRDTVAALEAFAAWVGLRTRAAVRGFVNDTQQEIALLYDPDMLAARHDPQGPITGSAGRGDAPRFDGIFRIDLDIDATEDLVRFSKPPLELAIETASGFEMRMIGAHLKSKAPHGAENHDEIMRISIANRRKQLAQAIWLRQRVTQHLNDKIPLVVLGDLNDGPGLDEFEHLFGRSSVEIVIGQDGAGTLFDPHAERALLRKLGATPTTARFYIHEEKRYLQALLDYIMVSPDLGALDPVWRIWHPFDDPDCWTRPELRDALIAASDHFPVTLDITL